MERIFTGQKLTKILVGFMAAAFLLGAYLIYEQFLQLVFAYPPKSLRAHAIFLVIITVTILWISLRFSNRLQQRVLEGIREVLAQAGLGIGLLDGHGRLVWYNQALARLFGIAGGWVRHPIVEMFEKAGAANAQVRWREDLSRIRAGEALDREFEFTRADGRRLTIYYALNPLRSDHGHSMGTLAVFMDVTERRRLSEELRASRDNLHRLIEAIPAGVTVVETATGRTILWNEAAERMLGVPRERVPEMDAIQPYLFHRVRRVFDAQGQAITPDQAPLPRTLRTREPVSGLHYMFELEDGRRVDVVASTAFLQTAEGGQAVLIFQDISAIQQLQRELTAERVQAKQLEAMLSTVATLHHEINNPLTAIFGSAELILMQPNLDAKMQHYTERILDLARRIGELLHILSVNTCFEHRTEVGFRELLKFERNSET